MKAGYRHLSCFLLTTALIVPATIMTGTPIQDDKRQEERREEKQQQQRRVYDRTHKDYHNWDDNENRAYHQYRGEQNQDNRDYSKLKRKQQADYWKWRHDHPDGDRDKH